MNKFLLLFLLFTGCSKVPKEALFSASIPGGAISRELPNIPVEKAAVNRDQQKKLDAILENELVKVDSLKLLQNQNSVPVLIKMIKNTQKYFYMNVLSFSCDEATEEMVSLLEGKAKAGVDVRLITNKYFSVLSLTCLKRLKTAGVKVLKTKTHSSYF